MEKIKIFLSSQLGAAKEMARIANSIIKVKDLVRHKKLRWIGQVQKIERVWPSWWYLSNWVTGPPFPWQYYDRVLVVLEDDGVLLEDALEEWEII